MRYWLMKSEPKTYSWEMFVKEGRTHWDGVRNYQAASNMKAMKLGDRAFFYHSNQGKEIVGVMEIVREYYPDHTDETGRFGMVDVQVLGAFKNPVTLAEIKADSRLQAMPLVKQSRLSVSPVSKEAWKIISAWGGVEF